ncbi:MAG: purine-nucleoside phosphorylase [Tissierellia bacterium]|nr:purine-nucleoside phosphorylase [Tissierellia bacterium]
MGTPHIEASKGDIAKTVLMPGDPLRAKFIAETYLDDVKQFNAVRNMFGYTGTYQGKEISVMGSGMGIPSIGIYSYELITKYGVENIIRIGSAGAYSPDLKLYDVVIGMGACTDSNFAHQYDLEGTYSAICSYDLLKKATDAAEKLGTEVHVGNIFSADVFYNKNSEEWKKWMDMGVLAVEMETYGLYCTAAATGANALTLLTISDSFHSEEKTTPEERQTSFTKMMEIALELA